MMKYIVTVAMLFASVQPAFATTDVWNQVDFSQIEAAELNQEGDLEIHEARGKGAAIVGGIIGGIIGGLIIADHFDRHPHKYRRVVCYAQDRRGRVYSALSNRARIAQRRAMDKCYAFSSFCRPLGCEGRW